MKHSFISRMLIAGLLCSLPFTGGCMEKTHEVYSEDSSEESRYSISSDREEESSEISSAEESSAESSEEKEKAQVVAEIGSLDGVPIKIYEQGWICEVNGKIGLMGTDGKWKIDPVYDSSLIMVFPDKESSVQTITEPVSLYDHESSDCMFVRADSIESGTFTGVGGTNPNIYMTNDQRSEVLLATPQGTYGSSSSQFDEYLPAQPITVYTESDGRAGNSTGNHPSFSIWSPATGTIHGPYSYGEYAAFGLYSHSGPIGLYNTVNINVPVNGPFWEKEDDGSYTVYSTQGTEMIRGLEYAEPAGADAMSIRQGDSVAVVDGSLRTLFITDGETAAQPIGDIAPVMQDGKWVLQKVNLK